MVPGILATFGILYVILSLAGFIFWLWMFIDLIKRKKEKNKVIWTLFFIFFSLITAIVWAITKKKW